MVNYRCVNLNYLMSALIIENHCDEHYRGFVELTHYFPIFPDSEHIGLQAFGLQRSHFA